MLQFIFLLLLYSKEKGLNIFSSKQLADGNVYKGFKLEEEGDLKGKIVTVNEAGIADEKNLPLDLSMTKTVVGIIVCCNNRPDDIPFTWHAPIRKQE